MKNYVELKTNVDFKLFNTNITMINILVFGYYNRQNWGDDVFKYIFESYIFKDSSKYNLKFKNLDDVAVETESYVSIDRVIIGGGDVINEYFFSDEKVQAFRKLFVGIPVYFVGVGLTYPNAINLMDIGDYFFMRNRTDYNLVRSRYTENYCTMIPDIAFNLLNEPTLSHPRKANKQIKRIGVCLPCTWLANTDNILDSIVGTISALAENAKIYLIPFDTSNSIVNSDIVLLNKVRDKMGENNSIEYMIPSLSNEKYNPISVTEMIDYFKSLDLVICGRFHSVVLSILTRTPFVAVYSSPKIENLRTDLPSDLNRLFVRLETDDSGVPLPFDPNRVLKVCKNIVSNHDSIITNIDMYNKTAKSDTIKCNTKLESMISVSSLRQSPPQYVTKSVKLSLITNTISSILKKVLNKVSISDIDYVMKGYPLSDILPKTKSRNLEPFRKLITEEILWTITGDPYGPYYYGLYDNVFKGTLLAQIEWVITDYYENFYFKQSNNSLITLVNKNFQELHRSGWQYIVNNMVVELNANGSVRSPFIIDTYIDKTFHWNKEFYQSKGIIPYKKSWIGFIHHTYSDYNNSYNCLELFKDKTFIESLKSCRCLIVMTEYLTEQVKSSLKEIGVNNVDVTTIIHPTENTDMMFNWNSFMGNEKRMVVQVGNWLRDVFGIYRVSLPDTSIISSKAILKNRNSENYFPPDNLMSMLLDELNPQETRLSIDICRNSFTNLHMKGLYNCILDMENSVEVLSYLENTEYDKLLSENIVFLNLVDASACNTLVECITRNTPIIINPIPAVVELLGPSYPLYYNTYNEVTKILENPQLIQQAHEYLKQMNKTSYDINTFISSLTSVIKRYSSL